MASLSDILLKPGERKRLTEEEIKRLHEKGFSTIGSVPEGTPRKPLPSVRERIEKQAETQLGIEKEMGLEMAIGSGTPLQQILKIPRFAGAVARGTTRLGAGGVLEHGVPFSGRSEPTTFTPETRAEKFVFGEAPVQPLSKQGEETLLDIGVPEDKAKAFGELAGFALLGIDLTPAGGPFRAAKTITTIKTLDKGRQFARSIGVAEDLIEPMAEAFVKANKLEEAQKVLRNMERLQTETRLATGASKATPQAGRGVPRTTQATRTAKTTDATVEATRADVVPPRRPPTPRQLGIQPPAAPFVRARETTLLKNRIRTLQRGVREGRRVAKQEIRQMQDDIINIAVQSLPVALRGSRNFLTKIRNANSPRGLEKALDDLSVRIGEYKEATRVLREQGTRRSKIAFIKKIGEFNQTTITDAKNKLNISKSISKMNEQELDSVVNEMRERLSFKMKKGFRPDIDERGTLKPDFTEDLYSANKSFQGQDTNSFTESLKAPFEGVRNLADELGGSISTRLANIHPVLKSKLRKFEFDLRKSTQKDQELLSSFLEKIQGKKVLGVRKGGMTQSDFWDFDFAVKNGDAEKINSLAKKYSFEKELDAVRSILDDLYKRANEVGFDVGYEKNYFPRMIKDAKGFMSHFENTEHWSILQEALSRKSMELGRNLTVEEKANIINNMIRGYRGGQITLSKTGAMKSRVIDFIDPELNQFYAPFDEALSRYIIQTNEAVEARRFFGKELPNAVDDSLNDLNNSIGSLTAKLISEGKITLEQEQELASILRARFGEHGVTNPVLGVYRTASYLDTLGGVDNALTQLGDLGLSIYAGGPRKGLGEGLKSLLGKTRLKKEDIGFAKEEISAEFRDKGRLRQALDTVFRLTGFRKIDRMGAESLANSAVQSFEVQARGFLQNPNTEAGRRFLNKVEDAFPEELFGKEAQERLIRDLANDNITEDVKFVAFNNVLDFSPRALSEMPEKYLSAGNGRVFWMLQSWTLKLLDVYRREAWHQIAQGNRRQGLRNLFALSASVMAMNATADTLKSLLMGREIEPDDLAVDNMLKLVGFSRYTTFQVQREGLFSALSAQFATPGAAPLIDNASKDVNNLFKDFDKSADINELRSVRSIPVGGDLYYWWFGKGSKTKQKTTGTPEVTIPSVEIPSVEIPEITIPEVTI